jgi:hypothetical protein
MSLDTLFESAGPPRDMLVVDAESLVQMKQTQVARDCPAIAAVAHLLAPELDLAYTTDPDRILALASRVPSALSRPSVQARARDRRSRPGRRRPGA